MNYRLISTMRSIIQHFKHEFVSPDCLYAKIETVGERLNKSVPQLMRTSKEDIKQIINLHRRDADDHKASVAQHPPAQNELDPKIGDCWLRVVTGRAWAKMNFDGGRMLIEICQTCSVPATTKHHLDECPLFKGERERL